MKAQSGAPEFVFCDKQAEPSFPVDPLAQGGSRLHFPIDPLAQGGSRLHFHVDPVAQGGSRLHFHIIF